MKTYEDCPDVASHAERAAAYSAARFGNRKTVGRRQALDFVRVGWGVGSFATIPDIGAALDRAISEGAIGFSHTVTFSVAYNRATGHSAGGSSQGSRGMSAPMFTLASVATWGETALIHFACKRTEADHYGS